MRLEDGHGFCPHCGTARPAPPQRQDPRPEEARSSAPASGARKKVPDQVTVIAVLSAATAVSFLVLLAQTAALITNAHGRESLNLSLAQAGVVASQRPGLLIVSEILAVLILLIPALLHGFAFYGLMGLRRGGWVLAFLLSLAWCLVLLGLPFAYMLWRRDTRAAFGFSS